MESGASNKQFHLFLVKGSKYQLLVFTYLYSMTDLQDGQPHESMDCGKSLVENEQNSFKPQRKKTSCTLYIKVSGVPWSKTKDNRVRTFLILSIIHCGFLG